MRDQDHGIRIAAQEGLEPIAGFEIQMVGRLVEQEQLRLAQEQLGQGDAHLPAAGKLAAVAVEVGRGEAEAAEDHLRAALEVVAAVGIPRLAGGGIRGHQGVVLRMIRSGVREIRLQPGAFIRDAVNVLEGGHRFGQDAAAADAERLLGQVADHRSLRNVDAAAVGFDLAGHHAQKGGFPGAVGADQSDPSAGGDEPVHPGQDNLPAERLLKVGNCQHGGSV